MSDHQISAHHIAGAGHGTRTSYAIGYGLSILLTIVPFLLVMRSSLPQGTIVIAIVVLAAIQIFVQLVFFLHLNTSSEQRWNLVALLYALIILLIVAGGSLWIMYHLNYNMMPH